METRPATAGSERRRLRMAHVCGSCANHYRKHPRPGPDSVIRADGFVFESFLRCRSKPSCGPVGRYKRCRKRGASRIFRIGSASRADDEIARHQNPTVNSAWRSRRFRIQHGHAFERRNFAQCFIRHDQVIGEIQVRQVERYSKLEGIHIVGGCAKPVPRRDRPACPSARQTPRTGPTPPRSPPNAARKMATFSSSV